jgi:hypothetical protein
MQQCGDLGGPESGLTPSAEGWLFPEQVHHQMIRDTGRHQLGGGRGVLTGLTPQQRCQSKAVSGFQLDQGHQSPLLGVKESSLALKEEKNVRRQTRGVGDRLSKAESHKSDVSLQLTPSGFGKTSERRMLCQ